MFKPSQSSMSVYLSFIFYSALAFSSASAMAQNAWHFTQPQYFLFDTINGKSNYEKSNLSPNIQNYKDNIYCSWVGTDNRINVQLIGESVVRQTKTLSDSAFQKVVLKSEYTSITAPSLAYASEKLYLFFRDEKTNTIKYNVINKSGEKFTPSAKDLNITKGLVDKKGGIYACEYGKNKLFLIWKNDNEIHYAFADINEQNGNLTVQNSFLLTESSTDAPSACYLSEKKIAIAWAGRNDKQNLNVMIMTDGKITTAKKTHYGSASSTTPIIYKKYGKDEIRMVWKGVGNDQNLWEGVFNATNLDMKQHKLSEKYNLSSAVAPSVAHIDENNYVLLWTGTDDKRFNISYASDYTYSGWMGQTLQDDQKLKEVVFPGSHDAGMADANYCSIGTNRCNTQTQIYSIKNQLEMGIRYFDIRPKKVSPDNDALYTYHGDGILDCAGEKLSTVLESANNFINNNKKEFIVLNITHLKGVSSGDLEKTIKEKIDSKNLFMKTSNQNTYHDLVDLPISSFRGKIIITSDHDDFRKLNYVLGDIFENGDQHRKFAETNNMAELQKSEKEFITTHANKYKRLDWQLTQSKTQAVACGASLVGCADGFRWSWSQILKVAIDCGGKGIVHYYAAISTPMGPALNAAVEIIINQNSILNMATLANQNLSPSVYRWKDEKIITKTNKINIIYVDIADERVTDLCIDLNRFYQSK